MNIISKSDLRYDYSWSKYDNYNSKIKESLDNTFFDRTEGNEILYFINKYCDNNKISNKSTALKIEEFLQTMMLDCSHTQQKIASFVSYYLSNG